MPTKSLIDETAHAEVKVEIDGKHVPPDWEENIEPSRVFNSAEPETEIENQFRDQLKRL